MDKETGPESNNKGKTAANVICLTLNGTIREKYIIWSKKSIQKVTIKGTVANVI